MQFTIVLCWDLHYNTHNNIYSTIIMKWLLFFLYGKFGASLPWVELCSPKGTYSMLWRNSPFGSRNFLMLSAEADANVCLHVSKVKLDAKFARITNQSKLDSDNYTDFDWVETKRTYNLLEYCAIQQKHFYAGDLWWQACLTGIYVYIWSLPGIVSWTHFPHTRVFGYDTSTSLKEVEALTRKDAWQGHARTSCGRSTSTSIFLQTLRSNN